MKILVVDGERAESSAIAGKLGERGHEIVRCFPEHGRGLCVGVDDPERCPVESLGCDVALIIRTTSQEPQLREMGAICALRRHIPLVEAWHDSSSPFAPWTTPAGTEVVEAVESYDSGFRPWLVAAVESRLSEIPAVRRLGHLPTIAVRRHGASLHLSATISADYSRAEEEAIVTWAVRALREADPHASTLDVTIRRS